MERTAAEDAQKQAQSQAQRQPKRAPSGKQFDNSSITCKVYRHQDDHYSKDCKNIPFRSYCQCDNELDKRQKAQNQNQRGKRGQGRGKSWPMDGFNGLNNNSLNNFSSQSNNFNGQNNNFNGQYKHFSGQNNNPGSQNHFSAQNNNFNSQNGDFNGQSGNKDGYSYGQNRNINGYNNQARYYNCGQNNGNNGGRNSPRFGSNKQNNAHPYGEQKAYGNRGQLRKKGETRYAQNQQIKRDVKQEPKGPQRKAQGTIGRFQPAMVLSKNDLDLISTPLYHRDLLPLKERIETRAREKGA